MSDLEREKLALCSKYGLHEGMAEYMRGNTIQELEGDAAKMAGADTTNEVERAKTKAAFYFCRSLGLPDEKAEEIKKGETFTGMKACAEVLAREAGNPSDHPGGAPEENDSVIRLVSPAAIDENRAMAKFAEAMGKALQ